MRTHTKSAIVLLSGGIFTNNLTRAQHGVAAAMGPINAPDDFRQQKPPPLHQPVPQKHRRTSEGWWL
jgi:hypothetical protein